MTVPTAMRPRLRTRSATSTRDAVTPASEGDVASSDASSSTTRFAPRSSAPPRCRSVARNADHERRDAFAVDSRWPAPALSTRRREGAASPLPSPVAWRSSSRNERPGAASPSKRAAAALSTRGARPRGQSTPSANSASARQSTPRADVNASRSSSRGSIRSHRSTRCQSKLRAAIPCACQRPPSPSWRDREPERSRRRPTRPSPGRRSDSIFTGRAPPLDAGQGAQGKRLGSQVRRAERAFRAAFEDAGAHSDRLERFPGGQGHGCLFRARMRDPDGAPRGRESAAPRSSSAKRHRSPSGLR